MSHRVLLVAACPFPCARGTPTRILRMAEALAARGHEVHVATYHLGSDEQIDGSFNIHRIRNVKSYSKMSAGPSYGKLFLLDPLLAAKIGQVIEQEDIEIVHAHHFEGLAAAHIAARKAGIPLIYDAHTTLSSELHYYGLGLPAAMKRRLAAFLDRQLPRLADHAITVSEEIRARLIDSGAMAAERISLLPNGVEMEHFGEASPVARNVVVYAGSLAPYHRLDLLLESFQLVLRQRPDAKLKIATEEDFSVYELACRRLGIRQATEVCVGGYAQLPAIFSGATVAVNPRVEGAGLPQKLLNYMAGGLPVVSFAGSARHMIDGQHGRIIANHDVQGFAAGIIGYLNDNDSARAHGGNAKQFVQDHFTWSQVAAQLEALYEQLAPQPPLRTTARAGSSVSAVVVNYNGGERIANTVRALMAAAPNMREVCVIDNASTDGSPEALVKEFPHLRLVRMSDNLGLPAARNAGLRQVPSGPVLLLDGDVYVAEETVERLTDALLAGGAAVACPRVIYHPRRDMIQCDGAEPHFIGTMTLRHADRPVNPAEDRPKRSVAQACIGACMVVDRDKILEAGGFDERFFFYFEDLEFSLRVRALGHDIAMVPSAVVYHDRGLGTPGLSYRGKGGYPERRAYLTMRNRWLVILTHYRLWTIILLAPSLLLYEIAIVAAKKEWRLAWLQCWRWIAAHRTEIRQHRKAMQSRRRVPDHRLLRGGPLPLAPGVANGLIARAGIRTLSVVANLNWAIARPLLRLAR